LLRLEIAKAGLFGWYCNKNGVRTQYSLIHKLTNTNQQGQPLAVPVTFMLNVVY